MLATARSKVEMTSTARLLVALLLGSTAFASNYKDQPDHETINWDDYVHDDPVETAKFRKKVVPLIHDYVFTHWEQYRNSEFTFRDLKTHLAQKLKVTYEHLKQDKFSIVIEDAVDDITNLCDAGAFTVSRCKRKLAYLDGNGHLLKDET